MSCKPMRLDSSCQIQLVRLSALVMLAMFAQHSNADCIMRQSLCVLAVFPGSPAIEASYITFIWQAKQSIEHRIMHLGRNACALHARAAAGNPSWPGQSSVQSLCTGWYAPCCSVLHGQGHGRATSRAQGEEGMIFCDMQHDCWVFIDKCIDMHLL